MRVKDIMVKEVATLSPEMSVRDAANILADRRISGLPVIDAAGKIIGMFTEKEILKEILPSYVEQVGKFVYETDTKAIRKKLASLNEVRIKEVMRREVLTITEDASISEAARVMLTQKARRLPVVDKDNKLTGIVARIDVLKAFTKEA